jgi:hypothetical protein
MKDKNIFNPQLFKQVVKSNLDMLFNEITTAAEETAILTGDPIMNDEDTRRMAVKYFNQKLAKALHNKLLTT